MPRPEPTGARRALRRLAAALAVGLAAPIAALGGTAGAEVLPICFPVLDTPAPYYGTFGDPRGGGTRTHEGEDIMGRPMFRLVAATDGVILNGTDGIRWRGTGHSEHSLRMRGDDGYYYAYLHLNDDTPGTDDDLAAYEHVFAPGIAPGVRVRAGQLLGYMGDSGNAGEGNDHLHFEIRRPATTVWLSVAIDPYDSLQASRRCAPLTSPTHAFTSMGGSVDANPDLASAASGTFDAFVRGTDGGLWTRAWVGGFTSWSPLGGALRGGPAAASPVGGRLDVFVRGTDDQLWQRTRTDGSWGPWTPLGGALRSDPDVSGGAGILDVAVQGTDGQVWTRRFAGGIWSGWTPLGGGLHGGPSVVTAGATSAVLVRGLDDALWIRRATAGAWGAWEPVGGILSSDPDAVGVGDVIHVVARGGDSRLWARDLSQATWSMVSLEAIVGGPAITTWGEGRLDVVAIGTDQRLYQTWNLGDGW